MGCSKAGDEMIGAATSGFSPCKARAKSRASVPALKRSVDGEICPGSSAAPYPCNPAFSLRSAIPIPIETRNQLMSNG
jgi:hypothetical protein